MWDDSLRSVPAAHRGLHSGPAAPENSLAAFAAAAEAGYAVELDVRLSADGDAFVFHDDSLLRMTGVDRPFSTADRTLLTGLRLLGGTERVPRLEEVLELMAGRTPLLIEIKSAGRVGPAEAIVAEMLRRYRGPVAVMSFDPFRVAWFRRHAPEVIRGQLAGDFRGESLAAWKKFVLRRLWLNVVSRPHFVAYDVRCLPYVVVERERNRGRPVLTWTVDSDEKMASARRWADNLIFENLRP